MVNNLSAAGKLKQIIDLPSDFHEAGTLGSAVLKTIYRMAENMEVHRSVETGCGKSTLLLSWLSAEHNVFTIRDYGDVPSSGYEFLRKSPLLNRKAVRFFFGPTQIMLPKWEEPGPLQLALIDGPHGFPFPQLEYYYLYPRLEESAILILDDIHIPTIAQMHEFLREDKMFLLEEIVGTTAFFRRTSHPTFNPTGDDWWIQEYNARRFKSPEPKRLKDMLNAAANRVLGK